MKKIEHKSGVDYRKQSTRDSFLHSQKMFESNENVESTQSVLTLALRYPKEPAFWMGLSVLFLHTASFEDAHWAIEKGLELEPEKLELHLLRCAAFLGDDELHKAAESASSSMNEIGLKSDLLSMRGSALMRMQNIKAALRDFRDAYNLAEDKKAKLAVDYSGYLLGAGKYDEAIELPNKEIQSNPEDMMLHILLANAYYLNQDYETYANEYRRAVKRNDGVPRAIDITSGRKFASAIGMKIGIEENVDSIYYLHLLDDSYADLPYPQSSVGYQD